MNIPKTTTATTASSSQTVEQKESKPIEQAAPEKLQEPSANESKGAQGLAEQTKASQNLQAEIQKNQLKQKLSQGCAETSTTKTSTATAGFESLDQLSAHHKLDAKQVADLKDFAKKHGVPEKDLIKIGGNDRYCGAEKLEAMKAYAITHDAANNGKLDPYTAKGMRDHFLPKMLEGKIGVRLSDTPNARATYNPLNEGNKKGYDPNTITVPKEGIDLNSTYDRSTIVHEGKHVVRDSQKRKMSFMDGEKEGHAVGMDYLLRDNKAVQYTPDGPKLNFDEFQKLLRNTAEPSDKKQLIELFAQAAEKNERAGKSHLNGPQLSGYKDLGYKDIGDFIRDREPVLGKKTFSDVYIDSKKFLNPKTEKKLREEMDQTIPNDGI